MTYAFSIPGQQGTPVEISVPPGVPSPDISLGTILSFGISMMFFIAIILALIFLMGGGISWAMSGGDKEKLDKARRTLVFSIIGLVIVVLSFFIVTFIATLLNAPEIVPEWARFGNPTPTPLLPFPGPV